MMTYKNLAALGLVFMSIACGGGSKKAVLSAADDSGKKDKSGNMVAKKAAEGFNAASDAFAGADKGGKWDDSTCKAVADRFLAASAEQKSAAGVALPEAHYNAGLAYQRCGDDANAKAQFEAAVGVDSKFHRARAQIALYKFKTSSNIDATIGELEQIIKDANYENAEALVSLAALQMQRGGAAGSSGCNSDLSCAQLNLRRALAKDDSYMPAFNQLALYYLEQAKAKDAGSKRKGGLVAASSKKVKVDAQRLDLAALVAAQAQKKNPNYAPIHNTTGLILVELQNYNGAVQAFGRARKLNPKFFEAQMNYAAVNLSFRGFSEAEQAYRAALALQPNTYEAHIGLALALRGQIGDSNAQQNIAEAQKHLDEAKKLDAGRPEAYFNEAILAQEYRAKRAGSEDETVKEFKKASDQYAAFVAKAESNPAYADAVKRSKERIQDIKDTIDFMAESKKMAEEDAKMQAEMAAQKKADEEAAKAEEEAAKKAESGGAATPPAAPAAPPAPPAK